MMKSRREPTRPPISAAKTTSYAQSGGLPHSLKALAEHGAGGDEPEGERQTEGLQGESEDVDFRLQGG